MSAKSAFIISSRIYRMKMRVVFTAVCIYHIIIYILHRVQWRWFNRKQTFSHAWPAQGLAGKDAALEQTEIRQRSGWKYVTICAANTFPPRGLYSRIVYIYIYTIHVGTHTHVLMHSHTHTRINEHKHTHTRWRNVRDCKCMRRQLYDMYRKISPTHYCAQQTSKNYTIYYTRGVVGTCNIIIAMIASEKH